MILTGPKISQMQRAGRITIEPFDKEQINPNSYNYRLGPKLGIPIVEDGVFKEVEFIKIPDVGYILQAKTMYLGHTHEILGSDTFAMRLIGRSSLGRLGLFLQVSADLGHTGSCHQWTLEIVSVKPFIVYPHMKIGQISFWMNFGEPKLYRQGYSCHNSPTTSKLTTMCLENEQ